MTCLLWYLHITIAPPSRYWIFQNLEEEHDMAYSGDEILFELLHFDWFHIPPIEIAKLSIEVADRKFSDAKISLRQLLCEKITAPAKDLFTPGIHEGLKKASAA